MTDMRDYVEISAHVTDPHKVTATHVQSGEVVGSFSGFQIYSSDLRWWLPITCGTAAKSFFTARADHPYHPVESNQCPTARPLLAVRTP